MDNRNIFIFVYKIYLSRNRSSRIDLLPYFYSFIDELTWKFWINKKVLDSMT